jgi:hypothetical protein
MNNESENPDMDMDTNEVTYNSAPRRFRTDDPQTKVIGKLKPGAKTDIIVFTIELGLFQIVAIANVPFEGTTEAPVYLKWKVKKTLDPNIPFQKSDWSNDPQTTVMGKLKAGEKNDTIVAHIPNVLGLFELICIISIPYEGTTEAPVYIKYKVKEPQLG